MEVDRPSKESSRKYTQQDDQRGATYQHLVDRMFRKQLGCNMEVSIDDILVNSWQMNQHIADLAETFDILRKHHMKLDPTTVPLDLPFFKGFRETKTLSRIKNTAIKAKALAEFMHEATLVEENKGSWLLHADGSSTLAGNGARMVLTNLEGDG
ncbi:hypothetical protein Sango_1272300 [Sesamum angolense]|uniref:Reverse transcriptase/retrotransposon-derived protein RNase H-like domain-containing protein n=1 Tax=Sesamum angolense TaxID=2727404 RepID=A0AAE2BUE0_9LAMI|nr:hypothetical protein Sango_1272300 [Sesamum angolense]